VVQKWRLSADQALDFVSNFIPNLVTFNVALSLELMRSFHGHVSGGDAKAHSEISRIDTDGFLASNPDGQLTV
jgi:hypothetical protein